MMRGRPQGCYQSGTGGTPSLAALDADRTDEVGMVSGIASVVHKAKWR